MRSVVAPRTPAKALATAASTCGLALVAGAPAHATPPGAFAGGGRPSHAVAVVAVDASRRLRVRSQVGFLHGLTADAPPARLIAPLRPALWRGMPLTADVGRARSFGARYMLVLSDLWGYPASGWYGRRPPWEDPSGWEAMVVDAVRRYAGDGVLWDVWNEPNQPSSWNGTRQQYFETYRMAYVAIRRVAGPGAVVAGPSTSGFSWSWATGLADYCRARRCEVNALTWHDVSAPWRGLLSSRLRRARAALLGNPRYGPVHLREIDVPETVSPAAQLGAGDQVGFFAELEAGGADGSARACWPDPRGKSNCALPTLDGLLDPVTGGPRAAWWATRWYARGVGARVAARSSDRAIAVLASSSGRGRAEVLLGALSMPHRLGVRPVRLRVRGLASERGRTCGARVTAQVVRPAGAGPVSPRRIAVALVRGRRGIVEVALPALAAGDAVLIEIDPGRARYGQSI